MTFQTQLSGLIFFFKYFYLVYHILDIYFSSVKIPPPLSKTKIEKTATLFFGVTFSFSHKITIFVNLIFSISNTFLK